MSGTQSPLPMNASTPYSLPSKYRIPRPRRDAVPRPALLTNTLERAADARLVLLQAPAGFGKTTLLVQLAEAFATLPGGQIVWVSLDPEDNDPNRLFAALFGALAALDLPWAAPPATVLAQLQDASPAARTALGLLIDALGGRPNTRIALVLDDLHHVNDEAALQLLDTLIARAPPELCLFIGSRVAPPLSLARWRAGGELVELGLEDLKFDLDTTQALCRQRGLTNTSNEALQAALARTHGWVAGLQLVLSSVRNDADLPSQIGHTAHRHLFDYFAQEVLTDLPQPLQQFVLYSSVLTELSPTQCQAVTGRADTKSVLNNLLHRQLFLSVLDDVLPVLRFHDLFRDYLREELERREPGMAAQLHARAATVEPIAERAVPHWLAAGCWTEALSALRQMADGLLAVGGTHRLERWLEQLPTDWPEPHSDAALLRGLCAWSRWDWVRARDEFQLSHDAFAREGRINDSFLALGMLGACHNALGDLNQAESVLAAAANAQLPPALQVPFESLRAWHGVARGDTEAVLSGLSAMADNATLAPETRYPNIVDMSYGHFIGLPGTRAPMERLRQLCRGERMVEVKVPALDAWLAFWHGEPNVSRETLQVMLQLQRHLPGDVMLSISALHLHSLHLTVQGQTAEALHVFGQVFDVMTPGYSQGWRRTYAHVQARIHWRAEDAAGLAGLLPDLSRVRSAREWPVLDTGAALVQGQHALLIGNLSTARTLLERAVILQCGGRLPVFMGDARFALAACYAEQRELSTAAVLFDELLAETLQDDGLGLLLEPPARLQSLWRKLESKLQCPVAAQIDLRRRLAIWEGADFPAKIVPVDDPLSAREREVMALLADGQSNKLIARALGLSLHTVKRHVANILTKLDLESRTQAVAHWHRR